MSAIVPLKTQKPSAPKAAQGGEEREYPWPLLSSKACHHLDWYPMLVKGDAGDGTDDYECEVCALCGSVRGLRRVQGGRQTPMLKGIWLVKAAEGGYVDWKNDPRYRWITVNADQGKGQPVLLRMDDEKGEGSTGTIVGGAGGSLNYRRITGVKKRGEYQTEAARRQKEVREKRRAAREADEESQRAAGVSEEEIEAQRKARRAALDTLKQEQQQAEAEYLKVAAEALGWDGVEGADRAAVNEMREAADRAVDNAQAAVLADHDEAMAQALGDARPEELDSSEVDDSGLGYMAKLEQAAEENGLSLEAAQALGRATTDAALQAAEEAGFIASAEDARARYDAMQEAAAKTREASADAGQTRIAFADEVAPDRARELLLAKEKLKAKQREIMARRREIEGALPSELAQVPKGVALVEIGTISDEEAVRRVEASLTTRAQVTTAKELLDTIEELEGGVESVEQHLLEGRHVQLQEVAQAVFSQPLTMRREVLDLLGPEAGGTLMAHLMRQELGEDEREAVRTALREEHIETQVDRARTALEDAQEHFEAAQAAFAGFGTVGELGAEGLEAASAAKAEKLRELREARQILGVTLGRLQMLGSMNAALAEGEGRTLDVPLGQINGAQAWQVGAALGLDRGEYEVQSDGPNKYIRIARDAFGKLIESPDPEQKEQYEAAVAIKRGDFDEDGWLAEGLMKRPSEKYYDDPDFTAGWGVDAAEILDGKYGAGLEAGLREYAGKMIANGGAAGVQSLRMKMFSAEWQADNLDDFQRQQFADAMRAVFPVEGADDNWVSVAEDLVKPFVEQSNAERAALDAQNIDIVSARDPIHRALQEVPEGKVAFTPLSRLTPQGKDLIRDYFWRRLVIDEKRPEAAETKERNEEIEQKAEEVVGAQGFMFDMPPVSEEERASFVARGAGEESEEERAARLARVSEGSTELAGGEREIKRGETEAFQEKLSAEEVERRDNAWARYVRALKGTGNAYATVQAVIQGELAESFAKHYGRETGRGLRTAPADVPNSLRHVIGLLPKDALERVLDADNGALREMYEGLRRRDTRGRYSEGEVANLAVRILEKAKKMQLTLFGDASPGAQRLSIGSTAEKQLKQAWAQVAPHFDPERPAHIIENLAQSGPKYVHQQRAIKMLEKAKRIGLHSSTGSGKSLISLGAFTQLHSQGKVQRGLYMVPPKVQAQFGGEINAYAEPGRYSHFSDPSASATERRAAYADPEKQMVVISHQAWRDDVTWAVAQDRFGGNEQEAADWLRTAERGETAEAVRAAVDAQGWKFDMNVVDEGHDTLNRKGKPDSRLARVIDATTDRAEYMMTMTATPVKNDPSEVYDLLRKVRPDKFPADGYENFRRKYGLNTEANREALQRLVAPYFYAKNVDTGVQERHSYTGTDLSPWQKDRYRKVLEDYNAARSAPEGSEQRREAIRALVPDESLRDLSPEQVAQKLDDLGGALGFTRDRAIARVLEHAPAEHNPRIQKVVEIVKRHAGRDDDGGQVPGLVFAQSLESVRLLADALKKEGLRVGVITGELSGADSELRRMDFNADGGRGKGDDLAQEAATRRKMAKYDILVGSGAAGTGLNMERARFLVHYDQPWTAKEIAQRNGRQNRLSQHWGEVEVHTLGTDVPYDRKRRELVERKRGLMTTFMEPTEQLDDTGLARRIREARAERLSNAAEVAMGVGERRRPAGGVPMQEAAT